MSQGTQAELNRAKESAKNAPVLESFKIDTKALNTPLIGAKGKTGSGGNKQKIMQYLKDHESSGIDSGQARQLIFGIPNHSSEKGKTGELFDVGGTKTRKPLREAQISLEADGYKPFRVRGIGNKKQYYSIQEKNVKAFLSQMSGQSVESL